MKQFSNVRRAVKKFFRKLSLWSLHKTLLEQLYSNTFSARKITAPTL